MKIYILIVSMLASSSIFSMQQYKDSVERSSSDIVIRRSSSRKNSISAASSEALIAAAAMRKTSPERDGSPRRRTNNNHKTKKVDETIGTQEVDTSKEILKNEMAKQNQQESKLIERKVIVAHSKNLTEKNTTNIERLIFILKKDENVITDRDDSSPRALLEKPIRQHIAEYIASITTKA